MKKSNSGERLYALLVNPRKFQDSKQVMECWAELFNVKEENTLRTAAKVTEHLAAMHHELQLVYEQMRAQNVPVELYVPALTHIENAISPMLLSAPWNNATQYLKPEVITTLSWVAYTLPDEVEYIAAEDIAEIARMVQELKNMLQSADLPYRLMMVIRHHIELMEKALSDYPIAGAKAFSEATKRTRAEALEVLDEVEENADKKEVKLFASICNKASAGIDAAIKIDALMGIYEKGKPVIQGIFKSLT